MKIKLIIFDLDGTLVDSAGDITNALNFAIAPYLNEKMTVERTIGLVGEGITRLMEKLLGEEKADIRPAVMERFLEFYGGHLTDLTTAYEGVRETLAKLGTYRKAIVSNKRELFSRRILEELDMAHYFDLVVGSDSVREKKPSPKPLLHVLGVFSLHPAEAVIVGDSNFDIEAGKAAGMKTVGVSYGYRPVSALGGADAVIDRFAELAGVLRKLEG